MRPLTSPDDPSAAKAAGSQVAAPSNPSATSSGQSQINVGWQDNSGDETQFQVHRSTGGPAGAFVLRSSTGPNVTTYRDEGLTAGTQYCYAIRAVRLRAGTTTFSPLSAAACAVTDPVPPPPAPAAASNASATAIGSSIVWVGWTAVWSSEMQFRIDRSTDGGALWNPIGTASSSDRSFTDSGAPSEQAICYRVVAFNASGAAPPSNTACVTTPPAAPTNLTVTLVDAQTLELAWTDNSAIEDGYIVFSYSMYVPCCGSEGGGTGCESGYSEGNYLITGVPSGTTSIRTPLDPNLGACGLTSFEVWATHDGTRSTSATAFYTAAP